MKNIILILILFCLFSCNNSQKTKIPSKEKNEINTKEKTNITFSDKYIQNNKYEIKYSIPKNWEKIDDEIKSIDLKGNVTALQTKYIDSINNSTIDIIYHIGKKGIILYNSKKEKIDGKNSKFIQVSERKIIISTEILKRNGKGNILTQSTKRIIVSFLNKKNDLIEFKFNVNLDNEEEEITKTFLNIISNIEIIK